MNEESIFAAALEKSDPGGRAAYLEEACAGDPNLRRRVEMLLRSHDSAGSFLQMPALGRADTANEGDTGATQGVSLVGNDLSLDFLAPSPNPEALGRLGHYEILEVVGRGGMGMVLRAFDEVLRRVVAIKVMSPELAASAAARQRFIREAQAAAAVRDEHVITIHGVEPSDRLPYLMMEYVKGISLQDRLDRSGPLEWKEILRIGMQTAAGLAAAHQQGLIHRDIKPANILLENGVQRVKITDFGLARAVDDASLTQSGVVAGTPQYMSPEQARGEPVDHRGDLFSLGSVLYAMCTGHAPFRASSAVAVLRRVSDDRPRPVREINPDVPDWLAAVIDKLHAKDPAHRFQSAKEVAELLGQHLVELQQPGRPVGRRVERPTDHPRPLRRRWAVAAAVLALAAGLGATEVTGVTHVGSYVATVLRIRTADGTLVVEINDPEVKVAIDGNGDEVVITGAGPQEVRLRPGSYRLRATKDGRAVAVSNELITITRGGKQVVKVSQDGAATASPRPALGGATALVPRASQANTGAVRNQELPRVIKAFPLTDAPLTRDGVTLDASRSVPSWRIEAKEKRTVRLYEVPKPSVEDCTVLFRAQLKSHLEGQAYLQMWCRMPDGGRYFSKGLDNPVSGTTEWSSYETPFYLKKGERPDMIQLDLVIEGKGLVFVRNIELLRGPLPPDFSGK